MTEGMAGIIAAHSGYGAYPHEDDDAWYVECDDCDWRELLTYGNTDRTAHAAHVAEQLTKAGYGLVPDVEPEYGAHFKGHSGPSAEVFGHGSVRDPNWWEKSTHMRLAGPWQELEPLPTTTPGELARATVELQRLARWPKP